MRRKPAVDQCLDHVDACEALDANYFYDAKRPSIRLAQQAGLSDAAIEKLFNIIIKPEDRQI